ncbi:putative thiol oxidoreductase [Feldmannia species virus]|uniref:Sulfhydryl oxidase n=1 Tax=Feldmannia species virus TaxID=39420 RepID=B5LWE6_9PHYC|nr:putative thiol oxidoreductase [Feldmannia species virus]ACH46809.1 putative thiol oxidoreductase [Feldmannia species virus]
MPKYSSLAMNGLATSEWGPAGWKFLHSVAHGFPTTPSVEEVNDYTIFFETVGSVLPCRLCRASYNEFIGRLPVEAANRDQLTRWLWKIHNMVNEKLGVVYKKSGFDEVSQKYESYRASCTKTGCVRDSWNRMTFQLALLLLIFFACVYGLAHR